MNLNHEEIWKGHKERINETPSKEQLNMIKFVGKGYKLSDGSMVHYIGGVYGLNGDFFLMSNIGEIRLLLDFSLVSRGRKKCIKIRKFMLIDEGIEKDLWVAQNSSFKLVGNYYEKIEEDKNGK
jgi:hypothetical protein